MFLVNSREGLFAATHRGLGGYAPTPQGHTLYRRYGANLQSSLTRVHPRALEYSSHPPVSVYGTGNIDSRLEAFLGTTVSTIPTALRRGWSASQVSVFMWGGFAYLTTYTLRATIPSVTSSNSMRPPITQSNLCRYRNINRFAIDYPFRTCLRSRLTLRWRASRRKPWVFGEEDSHFFYRYSCLHAHFHTLQCSLPVHLQRCMERSPTAVAHH